VLGCVDEKNKKKKKEKRKGRKPIAKKTTKSRPRWNACKHGTSRQEGVRYLSLLRERKVDLLPALEKQQSVPISI